MFFQEDYQYAKVLQDDSKGRLHGLFEGLNALGDFFCCNSAMSLS